MYEIKYRETTVPAEDGRTLALSYYILADDSRFPMRYGTKVVEGDSGESAQATDLTTNLDVIRTLVDKLFRAAVTPVTFPDVVTDHLSHNTPADPEQLLRALGAPGTLKGFFYAVYMIEQLERDPSTVNLITKQLYPDTAKHFGTSSLAVERSLRTVVTTCWNRSAHSLFNEVAGTALTKKPTNSEFLDMTAAYLRRRGQNNN